MQCLSQCYPQCQYQDEYDDKRWYHFFWVWTRQYSWNSLAQSLCSSLSWISLNLTSFSMQSISLSLHTFTRVSQDRYTCPPSKPSFSKSTLNSSLPPTLWCLWMWPSSSPSFSQNLSTTSSAFLAVLLTLDSRRRGLGYSTSDYDQLLASTSFLTGLGASLALSLFMAGLGSSSTTSTSSASSLCFLSLLASLLETLTCSALGPGVRLSYLRLNSLTSLSTWARCCMGSQVQSFCSGYPAHRIRYIIPLPVSFLSMISSTSQNSQLGSRFDFMFLKWARQKCVIG